MTVRELIEELNKVENKEERVLVFSDCTWDETTVVINPNQEAVGLFGISKVEKGDTE